MPMFRVPVTRDCTETAYAIVEAADADEAAEKATTNDVAATLNFTHDDGSEDDTYIADVDDIAEIEPPQNAECGNCGGIFHQDQLAEIENLSERVQAGEPMPAGQCPLEDCGALCHATDKPQPEFDVTCAYKQLSEVTFRMHAASEEHAEQLVNDNSFPEDANYAPLDGELIDCDVTQAVAP